MGFTWNSHNSLLSVIPLAAALPLWTLSLSFPISALLLFHILFLCLSHRRQFPSIFDIIADGVAGYRWPLFVFSQKGVEIFIWGPFSPPCFLLQVPSLKCNVLDAAAHAQHMWMLQMQWMLQLPLSELQLQLGRKFAHLQMPDCRFRGLPVAFENLKIISHLSHMQMVMAMKREWCGKDLVAQDGIKSEPPGTGSDKFVSSHLLIM